MKNLNLSLLFALTLNVLNANASEWFIERFNMSTADLDAAEAAAFRTVVDRIDNRAYPAAEMALASMLANSEDLDDTIRARMLANLAVLKAVNAGEEEALLDLTAAIELVETTRGPFDRQLIDLLMTKAEISRSVESFEIAEEALRRAQHIAHRHDGVYTPNQLPIVEALTYVHLEQGLVLDADREQRFNLRISEQVHGEDSAEIVPVLRQVGSYFANRANSLPTAATISSKEFQSQAEAFTDQYRYSLFREAIDLYDRAINIVENTRGPDDIALVPVLRGLANARLMQRTSPRYAERAMERATDIIINHPGTDVADHARALVELGDMYTITADTRAEEMYLEAWNLLSASEDLMDVRNDLFGTPKRLFPDRIPVIALDRQPISVEEGDPLFANVEYSVVDNGRVARVRVIDGNVPNEKKNMLRRHLRLARFRPRIVDGEMVSTEGLTLHQTFEVVLPDPEFSASFEQNP